MENCSHSTCQVTRDIVKRCLDGVEVSEEVLIHFNQSLVCVFLFKENLKLKKVLTKAVEMTSTPPNLLVSIEKLIEKQ